MHKNTDLVRKKGGVYQIALLVHFHLQSLNRYTQKINQAAKY